jgi:hypothetical protein
LIFFIQNTLRIWRISRRKVVPLIKSFKNIFYFKFSKLGKVLFGSNDIWNSLIWIRLCLIWFDFDSVWNGLDRCTHCSPSPHVSPTVPPLSERVIVPPTRARRDHVATGCPLSPPPPSVWPPSSQTLPPVYSLPWRPLKGDVHHHRPVSLRPFLPPEGSCANPLLPPCRVSNSGHRRAVGATKIRAAIVIPLPHLVSSTRTAFFALIGPHLTSYSFPSCCRTNLDHRRPPEAIAAVEAPLRCPFLPPHHRPTTRWAATSPNVTRLTPHDAPVL